jgi:hypothetical protein
MRAQFLRQIVHAFNKVLLDEKWNGIIVCKGIIVCTVPFREGGGGEEEERPLLHKYYQIKKPRTSVMRAGLKKVNT